MIEIGEASQTDIPRLIEIRHSAFSEQAPTVYSDREVETLLGDVDESELMQMIEEHKLFVAREGERIVGLAGWKDNNVRHIYVDPTHTRQGIASKLLSHVERDFQDRTGAKDIQAGVALHAEAFYLSNGYEVVSRAKAWDGSEYVKMVKRF